MADDPTEEERLISSTSNNQVQSSQQLTISTNNSTNLQSLTSSSSLGGYENENLNPIETIEREATSSVERSPSNTSNEPKDDEEHSIENIIFKDMSTWTMEDDMPSPMDSSTPIDSPDLHQLRHFSHAKKDHHHHILSDEEDDDTPMPLPPHPYLNSPSPPTTHHHSTFHQNHPSQHIHQPSSSSIIPPHTSNSTCFTVSSQLQSREARLYENVPSLPSHHHHSVGNGGVIIDSSNSQQSQLGLIFQPPSTSSALGSHHFHDGSNSNSNDFLSVHDFLNSVIVGGPPSHSSWVDSGRESLSFDGESTNTPNNSNSSRTVGGCSITQTPTSIFIQHSSSSHDFSPSRSTSSINNNMSRQNNNSNNGARTSGGGSRRENQLVRQKHTIDDNINNGISSINSNVSSSNPINSMCSFLPIPSPVRRSNTTNSPLISASSSTVSPINLHRHPTAQQLLLQENKKTRSLIPGSESPYISYALDNRSSTSNSYTGEHHSHSHQSHRPSKLPLGESLSNIGIGSSSFHDSSGSSSGKACNRISKLARSPSKGLFHSGAGGKYKVQHSINCARFNLQSKNENQFDYGELPSHQMFPKRHLLPITRQLSQPYNSNMNCTGGNLNGAGNGGSSTSNHTSNLGVSQLHQPQHRSFPANILNNIAPRSCSMGDLSGGSNGGNIPGKVGGAGGINHVTSSNTEYPNHLTAPTSSVLQQQSATNSGLSPMNSGMLGQQSSNGSHPLVASLPLPPQATSVTYEFSLAPISGTLAPGWHLTAVQRGLATAAVPLAAAVARRRLPRPRPIRPRFGFTDKNEARRAKWTIVITALALLAMSMLLVGITLRLAPLIDDLGKENSIYPN